MTAHPLDRTPALTSSDPTLTDEQVRAAVQQRYAAAARSTAALLERADPDRADASASAGCCAGECGPAGGGGDPITRELYAGEVPSAGALAASLGCGNPTLLADLQPGQTVLDLGSGGGLDVLLSARRVAPGGWAYGLDMTPEMLELARRNQREAGVDNAEFLEGRIEQVPLPDASVDVVVSNCVINLSPDKDAVLREAFRVLRPGGRFAVSDIVLLRPLPPELVGVVGLWTGCVAGALVDADYVAKLHAAGFADASVEVTRRFERDELEELAADLGAPGAPGGSAGRPGEPEPAGVSAVTGLGAAQLVEQLDGAFASAFVRAVKPA